MRRLFSSLFSALVLVLLFLPALASAEPPPGATTAGGTPSKCGVNAVEIGIPIIGTNKCISGDPSSGGVIVAYLQLVLQFLSTVVGAVVLLLVIIAGIQYIVSNGDPKAVADAKERLVNAITALVLFALAFAILSFVVPGGIL